MLLVTRILSSVGSRIKRIMPVKMPIALPSLRTLFAGLFMLALLFLTYVIGAGCMYFDLPFSSSMRKAFQGYEAWQDSRHLLRMHPSQEPLHAVILEDQPDRTWDGLTLYTTMSQQRATLIDMRGQVVHQWELPFDQVWPQATHVHSVLSADQILWFRCYLYPNGDLLVVYHGLNDTPCGYGLAKVNAESRLLWSYADAIHHAVDVDEKGDIYTLRQQIVSETPPGQEYLPTPYMVDELLVLSAEGKKLKSINLVEAFRASPYALILDRHDHPRMKRGQAPLGSAPAEWLHGDLFHTNSVQVLSSAQAPAFPLFKAGQVLVSIRNLDAIAVIDVDKGVVVWAAQGIWRHQHDAEFLENGHLLLFDNLGSDRHSRILEYDPRTQAVTWSFPADSKFPLHAPHLGVKQRFPNGNTLIADPDENTLFEVTPDQKVVWECSLVDRTANNPPHCSTTTMKRYNPANLTFLKEGCRARP